MKNNYLRINAALILLLFGGLGPLFGQGLPLLNQISIGGTNDDELGYAGKSLNSSNMWFFGNSSSGVSGNHTAVNFGNTDIWAVKTSEDLTPLVQVGIGGTADDRCVNIQVGSDFILCGGYSFSGANGNKTVPDYGMGDGYIVKLDTMGNILWQEHYGGVDADGLADFKIVSDSSFVGLFGTQSGISGNKTTPEVGINDLWLVEIALNDGHIIRQKTISSANSDNPRQLVINSNGNLLLLSESDPGTGGDKTDPGFGTNQYLPDIWVVELTPEWNIVRDKCFGGDGPEEFGRIFQVDGRTFLTCNTYSEPSGQIINPTYNANGYSDLWICEINENWNILWEKTFGGTDTDQGGSIAGLSDGSFILSITSNSPNGSGNRTCSKYGIRDVWTIWLDENLNERAQMSFGGTGFNSGYFAPYDGDNLMLVAGSDANISGNKTVNTYGMQDAWLGTVDFGSVLALKEHQNDFVNVFPNPFENTLSISGIDLSTSEISVLNALGQQQPREVTGQQIKIENLVPGVYTLVATEKNTGNVLVRKKVVRR